MKKILAIILASLMLVACFAGCAKESTTNDDTASATDVVSAADVSSTDTDVEDTTDEVVEDTTTAGAAVAYIMYADESWTNQYWYDGNEYAMKAETVEVTGEGDYVVGLTSETPAMGLAFTALGIDGGEAAFPNYCFTITAMTVNGELIAFNKPYTSSDDAITTRSNIYNAWVTALPDDARCAYGEVADCSPTVVDIADFAEVTEFKVYFTVTAPGTELDYEAKVAEIEASINA